MKKKIQFVLSCVLLAGVTTFIVSCGGDDEPKEPAVAELYYIDYDNAKIAKFTEVDPATVTDVLDIADNSGLGMAYNTSNNKIYFSGLDLDEIGGVWSVNLDGTGVANVVTDLYDPYGIALNVAGDKLYIADFGDTEGAIVRTNLNGSSRSNILEMEDESGFVSVSLDLVNNKMYYFPYDHENLYRANLDGTNREIIVEGAWGYAVYVDAANSKVYYNDRNLNGGELRSCSLTGTNPVTIDATASRIYGIAVHNNKLYWSARDNEAIYKSDLNGSNKITLKGGLPEGEFIPRAIFVK